uniref:Tyr recombinase domain-containing protein n=1 Tax=Clytia hemisphaerica TaxID=252671 RepID=A0A7M5XBI0_9CNID
MFFKDHAAIFIESSKTDVYREGHWVFVARLNSDLCPISNLERYLRIAGIENNSDKFIFRAVSKGRRCVEMLRKMDSPISYTSVREDIKKVLKRIGLNEKEYGVHSLRSGGASAAANLGVPDRLIMKHGRWKSIGVKNRYISEDLKNLLFISRNLGL